MNWPIARAVVYLRRIADALDRAYPVPRPVVRRKIELSVATVESFNAKYERELAAEEADGGTEQP